MTGAPLVSVVVPIHDQADLLAAALRTVLAQRLDDIEVLVSGDGCRDASEAVATGTGDARVRWLGFPKEPGYGYANRARAIATARGRYIAYLAPDDLWADDHLSRLTAAAQTGPLDFVFSKPIAVRADGILLPHFAPFDLGSSRSAAWTRLRVYFLSPSQALHTRELHDRVGGWRTPPLRHGDVDLWHRFGKAGARTGYLACPTVVRLPSYAFAARPAQRRALHERLAAQLVAGELDLAALRWPAHHRIGGWGRDLGRIAKARWRTYSRFAWDTVLGR